MDKTEKRICWYSSLLIAVMMSSPRLLALRENGIIAHYWHFNLGEVVFQMVFNLCYCYLFFTINLQHQKWLSLYRDQKKYTPYILFNGLLFILCCLVGGILQRHVFSDIQMRDLYWSGYITRYLLSMMLGGIVIKIILLLRESKQKDQENTSLKTVYLQAELELLKEQLNPHFLFNSLSSLSGLVRENPEMAQHFINHLSKIFRYALTQPGTHLVTIADELKMLQSYGQLLKMRFEEAFQLDIVAAGGFLEAKIPHLSLQPLLENAAKHNSSTLQSPLKVKVYIDGGYLVVCNNLQEITTPEDSTGIGLVNLNSRFRILMGHEIEIIKTMENFMVKLPIKI